MERPHPHSPDELAAALAALPPRERRLADELLTAANDLIADHPSTLDIKIAASALTEMGDAFAMFAPYRDRHKVSIFGSARTAPDDPLYRQACEVARQLAGAGWMVVTGAGPGIMQAAMEGAGRENSIGVSIRLPFETGANPVIAGDAKWVSMKYFFTRKLMLIKESQAFICLPGGFGTLDETFELITLTQTGKGLPVPIVFLDAAGDDYWERVDEFVRTELVSRHLVSASDRGLYRVVNTADDAVAEILRFYRNYHSIRQVGDTLVVRIRHVPTAAQLAALNERFDGTLTASPIRVVAPLSAERRDGDHLDLPRIAFRFERHGYGELRELIDALNDLAAG